MLKTIYIEQVRKGANNPYELMFNDMGFVQTENVKEADVLCLTGGSVVSPPLYDANIHPRTHFSPERDITCSDLYTYAKDNDLPMVGICRGSQFLNVMNGGKLYQDVTGHLRIHTAWDEEERAWEVSSTHHQMMVPSKDGEIVLDGGFIAGIRELERFGQEDPNPEMRDVESVYYKGTNTLCFQPHPEFYCKDHDCRKIFCKLFKKLGV